MNLRAMTAAYLETALATSPAPDGLETLDRYPRTGGWSLDALEAAEATCRCLLNTMRRRGWLDLYPGTAEQLGRDLWLTRNHHGAGFWDRKELTEIPTATGESLGDALTRLVQHWPFGEVDAYVGNDGLIYF